MRRNLWMGKKALARAGRKYGLIGGLAVMTAAGMTGCQSKQYEKVVLETEGKVVETVAVSGVITQGQQAVSASKTEGAGTETAGAGIEAAGAETEGVGTENTGAEQESWQAPDFEEREETVYVCAENLNVRQEPRSDGPVITTVNTGEEMKRTGYSDTWSRVVYQGQECYVASQYLSATKPEVLETTAASGESSVGQAEEIGLNPDWKYAGFAKITSGKAVLYRSEAADRKGKVVCVNAGHGTKGGASVKTQCHPDGTPKVTGGTTGAGATSAAAVSGGMQFADGTAEAKVTLAMAKVLKDKLLARGYDVLMIRESDDVQLDNVARTVIANNKADCHIALHWDSTESNKGAFYMSVPNIASYRSMEPVASHWQQHHELGDSLIAGLKNAGVKIFSSGKMDMDLTQTSYSTVPSVDIELGDKASDHSAATLDQLGNGLADGVDLFFAN